MFTVLELYTTIGEVILLEKRHFFIGVADVPAASTPQEKKEEKI